MGLIRNSSTCYQVALGRWLCISPSKRVPPEYDDASATLTSASNQRCLAQQGTAAHALIDTAVVRATKAHLKHLFIVSPPRHRVAKDGVSRAAFLELLGRPVLDGKLQMIYWLSDNADRPKEIIMKKTQSLHTALLRCLYAQRPYLLVSVEVWMPKLCQPPECTLYLIL